jgi:lysophospholipase L1-like esterase
VLVLKYKILCIGDSHTAGFPYFDPSSGGNPESSYEYWLCNLLESKYSSFSVSLANEGICGQTTREINRRLKSKLNQEAYSLVIYWGGANDIAVGYNTKDIWENIYNAYLRTRDRSIKFMVVTIPPMNWPGFNKRVTDINRKIRNFMNNSGTYFITDVFLDLEKNGNLNSKYDAGDGVHLSIEGYKQVAKTIFRSISRIL